MRRKHGNPYSGVNYICLVYMPCIIKECKRHVRVHTSTRVSSNPPKLCYDVVFCHTYNYLFSFIIYNTTYHHLTIIMCYNPAFKSMGLFLLFLYLLSRFPHVEYQKRLTTRHFTLRSVLWVWILNGFNYWNMKIRPDCVCASLD